MKTHLDLFSGIGGFAIAAQACGYTTIGFCEKEKYAQQILKERFGAVLADAESSEPRKSSERQGREDSSRGSGDRCGTAAARPMPRIHDNIFTLNGADYAGVDLLTGGFPCQPFSVAGKRKGAADDRALWPEMLRVIDGAKPAWIIGENVAGIVTMELDNILSDLEGIGYAAWPLVIPACAVDARHRRDRVWIVAHAGHLCGRGRAESAGQERAETSNNGQNDGDAKRPRCEGDDHNAKSSRGIQHELAESVRWEPEPELGRVAHGIPNRAHRLRGLGNAIVPQVAYEIIRAIPPHIPGREIALAMGAV
jgi:DNA (cytosine-5)-methyltransferase 1